MNRKSLGNRIRTERKRLNLTQEQLAECIGVSSTYVGLIERGERSVTLDNLILIANTLHVSIDYLLMDSVEVSSDSNFSLMKKLWQQATPSEQALLIEIAKSILLHSV